MLLLNILMVPNCCNLHWNFLYYTVFSVFFALQHCQFSYNMTRNVRQANLARIKYLAFIYLFVCFWFVVCRPGAGGLGDLFRTHMFMNAGNVGRYRVFQKIYVFRKILLHPSVYCDCLLTCCQLNLYIWAVVCYWFATFLRLIETQCW